MTGEGMAIIWASNSIYIDPIGIIIINKRIVGIWLDTVKNTIYHYNISDSTYLWLLIVQWILSSITAGSPMVGTLTPLQLVVVGGSCSSVEEHWHGKPMALGLSPSSSPFFPALSPFQRSTDSNGEIRSLIRPWLIGRWINRSPGHRTPSCDTAQDPLSLLLYHFSKELMDQSHMYMYTWACKESLRFFPQVTACITSSTKLRQYI